MVTHSESNKIVYSEWANFNLPQSVKCNLLIWGDTLWSCASLVLLWHPIVTSSSTPSAAPTPRPHQHFRSHDPHIPPRIPDRILLASPTHTSPTAPSPHPHQHPRSHPLHILTPIPLPHPLHIHTNIPTRTHPASPPTSLAAHTPHPLQHPHPYPPRILSKLQHPHPLPPPSPPTPPQAPTPHPHQHPPFTTLFICHNSFYIFYPRTVYDESLTPAGMHGRYSQPATLPANFHHLHSTCYTPSTTLRQLHLLRPYNIHCADAVNEMSHQLFSWLRPLFYRWRGSVKLICGRAIRAALRRVTANTQLTTGQFLE